MEVGTGVQVGGQVMGNGGNTGVTAGQVGAAGSEMTGELVHGKAEKAKKNMSLGIG